MENDHDGTRPQWNMTAMEHDCNGTRLQWNTTAMEHDAAFSDSNKVNTCL